ncbi:MAG: hypothetical protein JKY93_02285 [Gammaproteobacteria bacterium]|nr:hypothetical protein [Gammaproteobacteria bacterium]
MKISKLILLLEREKKRLGDIEVTMQATVLEDGYASNEGGNIPDVFESTIESSRDYDDGRLGKRLKLFWQM